jgi:hypothetical protein
VIEKLAFRTEVGYLGGDTYGNTVSILLADALSFCLPLFEGMLVLELGSHGEDGCSGVSEDESEESMGSGGEDRRLKWMRWS